MLQNTWKSGLTLFLDAKWIPNAIRDCSRVSTLRKISFLKENDFITIKFKEINQYILSMVHLNSSDDSLCFEWIESIRKQILCYSVKISDLESSEIIYLSPKCTTIRKEAFNGQNIVHMPRFLGYDHALLITDNCRCIKIIDFYDGSVEMNIRQKSKIFFCFRNWKQLSNWL